MDVIQIQIMACSSRITNCVEVDLCIAIERCHLTHDMEKQWLLIKFKKQFWLENSLQFDGWHDCDVISLYPSKHLWFLTTFVLSGTKIHIKTTCLYILFSLNPHLIVITKDYYACTSSPYNTNWVKAQRQP